MLATAHKYRWWAFAVLCALFVVWIVLGSPSFQSCINQSQSNDAKNELQKIVTDLLIYRGCIGPFLHVNESDITAVSTAVIAVFTTILGIFTVSLARSTRIAAEAAKKSADTLSGTERAQVFMVIDSQNISSIMGRFTAYEKSASQGMRFGEKLQVWFKFKNYGKSPALVREISRFLSHSAKLPDTIEYIPVDTVLKESVIAANGTTESMECLFIDAISGYEVSEIVRGQRSIWFYGRVLYDDAFGVEHEHRFVWKCNGGSHGFRPVHHPEHSKNT